MSCSFCIEQRPKTTLHSDWLTSSVINIAYHVTCSCLFVTGQLSDIAFIFIFTLHVSFSFNVFPVCQLVIKLSVLNVKCEVNVLFYTCLFLIESKSYSYLMDHCSEQYLLQFTICHLPKLNVSLLAK